MFTWQIPVVNPVAEISEKIAFSKPTKLQFVTLKGLDGAPPTKLRIAEPTVLALPLKSILLHSNE